MYIKKDILELYNNIENSFEKIQDKKLLYMAFSFAYKKHKNEKNIDWELIINHILKTTIILISIIKEIKIALSSILHHCLILNEEENKYIEKHFSLEVLNILKWFKALTDIKYKEGEITQNPTLFNHFLKASWNDIRVFLIKICSRLDFIKNFKNLSTEEKKKSSIETLEIYIPLIRLFWLNKYIKDIEDLCFKNIKPKEYGEVEKILLEKKEFLENKIGNIKESIKDLAIENDIDIKLEWRIKSIYSLAKKMNTKKVPISGIYDLIALRIITNTKKEAYIFLWLIHSIFKSKENRIKDYISSPKPNWYQSIHTTVIDNEWYIFEIQIQTKQMYEFNIFWIASHNLYKWTIKNPKSYPEWMKKIHNDKKKYILWDNISDLFNNTFASNTIICITPNFNRIELPKNSTILDFAFKIHTNFWNRVAGAWVNWEFIQNLVYILKNNDRIKLDLQKKEINFDIKYISKVKTKVAKKNIILSFKSKSEQKVEELWKFLLDERTELLEYRTFDKMPKILRKNILEKNNIENKEKLYYEIWTWNISLDKIVKQISNLEENKWKYKTIVKLVIKFKVINYKNINLLFNVFHNHNINIINIDYKWINTIIEINVANTELLNDLLVEIWRLPNIYKVKRIFSTNVKRFIIIFSLFTLWTLTHPLVIIFSNSIFNIPELLYKVLFYTNILFFISMIYFLKYIAKVSLPWLIWRNLFWKLMFLLNTFNLIIVIFESIYILKDQNIILLFSLVLLLYWLTFFEYLDSKNKKNS